jgi:zinc transporter, ZIP family
VSATQIALLGAVAGFTIYLGLPIGRLRAPMPKLKALLNATATGILIFLIWDVLEHAWEPIDGALSDKHYGSALGNGAVMVAGVGVGLLGLVYFDRWVARRTAKRRANTTGETGPAGGGVPGGGGGVVADTGHTQGRNGVPAGGAGAVATLTRSTAAPAATSMFASTAAQLALLIAVGIGLHNFAEGLAIGSSAAAGEIALAVMLIIGFGLHNATEGFGIVAPLAAAADQPSWGYLGLLGLIGGGPTFVGTVIGQRFTNETVSVAFLALAAGSILYVVIEMLAVARRFNLKEITTWGLFLGLTLGFATDALVTAAGA